MKILQLPVYITIKELKEFSRRKSGYGYMTWDIARSIAKKKSIDVDLLTRYNITEGIKYEKVNILDNTWWQIIRNIKTSNIVDVINTIFEENLSIKKIPYLFYYFLSMGYLDKILKQGNYDIVHIHGVGDFTEPIIKICEKRGLNLVVTLHGLNSFSSSIKISEREKRIERNFLAYAEKTKLPVTVVSSGVRDKILNYLKINRCENFDVITNGCDIDLEKSVTVDIRHFHGIDNEKKIILCVGRIDNNKNQVQIIRSFSEINPGLREKLVILFLGADGSKGEFQKTLRESEFNSQLIFCGFTPKEKLAAYYEQADFNIVASIHEGFGLSIIEGFGYGLPCLTFEDLDAVSDLYHHNAMVLVNSRTDDKLGKGIEKLVSNDWNKEFIKKYSDKFSLKNMADKYIEFFKSQIRE